MNSCCNLHCNVISLQDFGLLIRGIPGSGKSSLSLGLLDQAELRGIQASLVSDDQAILEKRNHTLVARVPESISGQIEIRGYGIASRPFIPETEINLVVELVDAELVDRMPNPEFTEILGVTLPLVKVPSQHEAGASRIVFSTLDDIVAGQGSI